jgi:ABC-type Fe3+ transport system permease subunit
MGYFVARVKMPGKNLLLSLGILPVIMPSFVGAFSWIILLGRQGVLRHYIRIPSVSKSELMNSLYLSTVATFLTAILGSIIAYITERRRPKGVASLTQLDPTLEESSTIAGANWFYTFRRVSLPLILPGIISGSILTFSTLLQELSTTILLYGARTRTVPIQIYSAVADGKMGEASALSVILLLVVFIIVYLMNIFQGNKMANSFKMG